MITVSRIVDEVANEFSIKRKDLISHRRPYDMIAARMMLYALTYELTALTSTQIARIIKRDPTTVLAGKINGETLIRRDPVFATHAQRIRDRLLAELGEQI